MGTDYQDMLERTEETNCKGQTGKLQGHEEGTKTEEQTRSPEGIPTGKKIRPTLEKVKGTSQITRERFYEQPEKDTHLFTVIKDLKLCINKFADNKGLIYLVARRFWRTDGYLVDWIAKRVRERMKRKQ